MNSYELIAGYGFKLVARKRYSVQEMRDKLEAYTGKHKKLKKVDTEEEVERFMSRLMELKYLDDGQFIKDYVAERMKFRPRGKRLLRLELIKKKISKIDIEKFFSENSIDEEGAAERLLRSKVKRWRGEQVWSQKAKAYRFLAGKGFDRDAIYRAVGRCYNLVE